MSHKITLTGTPTSELRSVGDIFNFDMTQTTKNIAKGLPMPENPIVYTVFLNKKQLNKLSVSKQEFPTLNLLVQGEPTLDIPIPNCPGEIGVLCIQIGRVPNKEKKNEEDVIAEKEAQAACKEVAATATPAMEWIDITQILISEKFQKTPPNPLKVAEKKEIIQRSGEFDKPLVLSKKNVLQDGYSRYVAAVELGFHEVPVRYK